MHVVGIRNNTNAIFESQSYNTDNQKSLLEENILKDAISSDLDIRIEYLTDDELNSILTPTPTQEELIKAELSELDSFLPRCVEDLIAVQGIDVMTLPQVMRDRLNRKVELRNQLQVILGS
jgi:hypothetical protein